MNYGYCRCSTNEDLQDIDRQKRELKKLGIDEANIFFEYGGGTKANRPQFNRLLNTVKQGDIIVTTEISRLTRSTKQLCEIIEIAKNKGLKLIIGTFVVDCTHDLDPMTDGMLKMMGVFAEMERNMISERVKSGMENAKAKGKKVGRPETNIDNLPAQFLKHYKKYENKEITVTEYARLCELSRNSIYKYIAVYNKRIK